MRKLDIKHRHNSMRGWFAYELHRQMAKDDKIYVISGDLGFLMLDFIRRDYPKRFINVGAAEQSMIGVAVGLALMDKKPFVYTITTFLLYRPFETIRNYINNEKIPVRLIGSGRNNDYNHDGFSHWAFEDRKIMKILKNITPFWPEDKTEIPKIVKNMVKTSKPYYLNLKKT